MSFPRYPAYKDSGVEWLGEVPAHWATLPVKWCLTSITQGWSPQCEGSPADVGQWGVLKVGCVNGGRFNPEENKALPDQLEPMPELSIRRGDVLVSRANTRDLVGSVAMAEQDFDWLLLCDKLYRLRVAVERCDPAFLALALSSSAARSRIEMSATGASSSMLNIGQSAILSMVIALPTVEEQQAALLFLHHETAKIDALIEEQKRLIELLKEKRQAVISQAVTKGLDPSVPMKDSGVEWLGKVPAHWAVAAVAYRYEVLLGKMLDEKRITGNHLAPYLRNVDVQWDRINTDDLPLMDFCGADLERYGLVPGDLLVCEGGDVGRAAIWRVGLAECFYQKALHRLRRRDIDADISRFMLYILRMAAARGLFFASEGKSTIAHLTAEALRRYRFGFPSLSEQSTIVAFLDEQTARIDELIAEAESAMLLLQERRSAVISAAVTGKIDLRHYQTEVA